jgi:hypothetical protein
MSYNKFISVTLIHQTNVYNLNKTALSLKFNLSFNFNTFGSEFDFKYIKINQIASFLSNNFFQLSRFRTIFIKKKILKKILFSSIFTKNLNFANYFKLYVLYFFNIYYTKPIKYNYSDNCLLFYLDNPNNFFRGNLKLKQKIQLKLNFSCFKKHCRGIFYRYISQQLLAKIFITVKKKNEILVV